MTPTAELPYLELPYVDEHATAVAAGTDAVWAALLGTVDRTFDRTRVARYARLVGSPDHAATGPRPLTAGSTVPGFHVSAAVPGTELALSGRHRFSSYALIFHLDPVDAGHSRLRAQTRATFPGLAGRGYRLAVIGSGGHRVVVRRLLASIRTRAERG